VYYDDPQVAAAVAAVELFMEHRDTTLANIAAPHDPESQVAPTDLLRQPIDGFVAA